jgi:hypothetical protein
MKTGAMMFDWQIMWKGHKSLSNGYKKKKQKRKKKKEKKRNLRETTMFLDIRMCRDRICLQG